VRARDRGAVRLSAASRSRIGAIEPVSSKARGGIDLGGTKIQAAIVDADNQVLGEARESTPTKGGPADVAEAMASALRAAAEEAEVEPAALDGVGVGSPGVVDAAAGTVADAGNLPGWEGTFGLGEALAEALGTRVRIGNDVQVATDAEFRLGAGQPYESIIGVFWGTGVGGGLVLDGRDWLGRWAAGEIGHVVVEIGGARCPCGRRGCMEAYAGRRGMEEEARRLHKDGKHTELFKIMKRKGFDRLKSSVWEEALEDGDAVAKHLLDRAVKALGAGIGSAVNVLDPEAVIIGGGLGVRFGEPFRERIEHQMRKHVFFDERPPPVLVAELGDLGGAIGASLLLTSND
jgi:glucokinase